MTPHTRIPDMWHECASHQLQQSLVTMKCNASLKPQLVKPAQSNAEQAAVTALAEMTCSGVEQAQTQAQCRYHSYSVGANLPKRPPALYATVATPQGCKSREARLQACTPLHTQQVASITQALLAWQARTLAATHRAPQNITATSLYIQHKGTQLHDQPLVSCKCSQ